MPSLNFKGKALVQNFHLLVPYHELKPVKSKSLTEKVSLHDNLVVHGDNLKALKALLPYYHGKVKCIYIDPPYNTGNEKRVYSDNVSSPMIQEWLGKVVDREDLTRHDKWLCMMMPRLKLLREFLADDGVIFVSIDDNEMHWLRGLMDEVFGEENFAAQVTVQSNPKGRVLSEGFARTHDYIVVYSRRPSGVDFELEKSEEEIATQYTEQDADGKFRLLELRNTHRQFGKHNRPNLYYPLYVNPGTGAVSVGKKTRWAKALPDWDDGFKGCWSWESAKSAKDDQLLFGRQIEGRWRVFRKAYAITADGETARKKPRTIWLEKEIHTEKGQQTVDEIFGKRLFYAPKPVDLIARCIQLAGDENAVVLDCFGGSGTTGHAVLRLNKQDGGKRRFVVIESEDFAESVTAQRIRRVITGVQKAEDEELREGLGGSFTFAEIGQPMQLETLLKADMLPSYADLASYVFYMATGADFDSTRINRKTGFIGESAQYDVYLLYEPDIGYLKSTALTLDIARGLPKGSGKKRLIFAPTKYLDSIHLDEHCIEFCQLPFEIYKAVKRTP
jgi:adenine-specific DNA-methyltransferase